MSLMIVPNSNAKSLISASAEARVSVRLTSRSSVLRVSTTVNRLMGGFGVGLIIVRFLKSGAATDRRDAMEGGSCTQVRGPV
jgi:hypothetical protein